VHYARHACAHRCGMFNCLGALPNDVLALVRGCWKGMNWESLYSV